MPADRTKPLLKTEGLSRQYGNIVALHPLTLTIHAGEVFGYIGPNGAGKTTTFRLLCGLLTPSAGKAFIDGQEVTGSVDRVKQLVGYLPDNFGIYPTLRVWEYLDFFAAAYKIPKKLRPARIHECLIIANAQDYRQKLMGELSRGMKQRVGIAKTLLHDPKVVILDEPAATIDPRARIQMRRLLRDLANLGKAVLVSSHILPELADVCDTVGILSAGKLIAYGEIQDVMRSICQKRVIEVRVLKLVEKAAAMLASESGDWRLVSDDKKKGILRYEVDANETQLSTTLQKLIEHKIPVLAFGEVTADLEDVFMALTK